MTDFILKRVLYSVYHLNSPYFPNFSNFNPECHYRSPTNFCDCPLAVIHLPSVNGNLASLNLARPELALYPDLYSSIKANLLVMLSSKPISLPEFSLQKYHYILIKQVLRSSTVLSTKQQGEIRHLLIVLRMSLLWMAKNI